MDKSASMRPRVFPAEDPRFDLEDPAGQGRFNEAAGIPRGRRYTACRPRHTRACFNEAAGIPRGRRYRGAQGFDPRGGFNEAAGIPRGRPGRYVEEEEAMPASMRPRVFPAEDPPGLDHFTSRRELQ